MILAAFRVRSFRFQFPADLLTSLSFEMETVILSWYVIAQTGSVLLLTAYGSLLYVGTLLSPMYGVLGDRLGGRAVLFAMRAVYVVLALVLAVLSLSGNLTPLSVFVVAGVAGLVRPNDLVLRNSLIGETIPSQHLMGAVGLSRMTADFARVLGALAGAELSTFLGIGPTYLLVTVFYGASLALTVGVARRRPVADPGRDSGAGAIAMSSPSRGRDLKDGVLFVWRTPALLAPMWLAFLINLTAYPVSNGILAYTAKNVFSVGAPGLGWLVAAFAFGGLLGSIATIVTGGPRRPERFMLVCTAIWYASCSASATRKPAHGTVGTPPRRLRPERRDDLDDRQPAQGRGRAVPQPRDGRPDARGLRPPAGTDGRRRADRSHRLSDDHQRAVGGRSHVHAPHRDQVAGEPLALTSP